MGERSYGRRTTPNPQVMRWMNDDGELVGFVRGYVGCKFASLFQQVGRTGAQGSVAHRERRDPVDGESRDFWASNSL